MDMITNKLFERLRKNWHYSQEVLALNKYLKNPVWVMLPEVPETYAEFKSLETTSDLVKALGMRTKDRKELFRVFRILKISGKKKTLTWFNSSDKKNAVCYTLRYNNGVFGCLVLCGIKKIMSDDFQKVFIAIVDAAIRESRKEIELEEINKTIRPRAIALSTVHTVHRLMTSTFDLDVLLTRIARLSLQVMKANRCSIKMVDKKRKTLLPKTTIDLRKEKTKLKKVQIGKYAPGRAVKKETPIRGKSYIAVPMIDKEVVGVITVYDKLDGTEFTAFDSEIAKTLSEQSAIAIKNAQLFKEQADLTLSSIRCIARLLEDSPHGVHKAEASFLRLIEIIGPKFRLNEREIKVLQYAAMLHDAGQISIPEKVLMKQGGLTGLEYEMVKTHPTRGAAILSRFKPLKPIVPIIKYHHENFDGTGYPKGLKGKAIPLSARILAVIGGFEAMITKKPYRKALSISAAIKEVQKNSGVQFDPKIVEVFCAAVQRKNILRLLRKELGNG